MKWSPFETTGDSMADGMGGNMCEDCHKVSKNYGLPDENLRRWCCGCGKKYGAVLLSKYYQQNGTAAAPKPPKPLLNGPRGRYATSPSHICVSRHA